MKVTLPSFCFQICSLLTHHNLLAECIWTPASTGLWECSELGAPAAFQWPTIHPLTATLVLQCKCKSKVRAFTFKQKACQIQASLQGLISPHNSINAKGSKYLFHVAHSTGSLLPFCGTQPFLQAVQISSLELCFLQLLQPDKSRAFEPLPGSPDAVLPLQACQSQITPGAGSHLI